MLLPAVGSGLSCAPIFTVGIGGVPDRDQGSASGILDSPQEPGPAVGVTVLGAVATAAAPASSPQPP
ncbi:MFS transporter [Thermomonospora catenispora]|uniref:MFS transporter n=1 Tax=Thermomonospora catenispora TaxID=2493090 RepID=UPI00111E53C7|nr:MFS transporter [Thermomonospora catenispora]TNY36979.1 hypothetical protein EIO00_10485 [Thermomonospora catenispora]